MEVLVLVLVLVLTKVLFTSLKKLPRVVYGVVRIEPLRFLAGILYKATKPGYLSMFYCVVVVYLGQFLCTVSFRWYVFCLLVVLARFQYLPSDWLERLLWGSLTVARDRLQKAQAKECVWFSCFFLLLFHCSVVWLCCSPALRDIHCTCTSTAQYSQFVLKVPLNNNTPNQTLKNC